MSSPFQGILTSEGVSNILSAGSNGGALTVTSFSVSATAGDLDPSRTTANSTWYVGAFSPPAIMTDSKIDVSITIPPSSIANPIADLSPIAELYLFANVSGGAEFLLAIIRPPDNIPIIYSDIVEYVIMLEMQFSSDNLTGVFNFIYNAGDVEAHNLDPNAHQRRWVLKAGDTMEGALHEAVATSKASVSGVLSLDETSNSFIATGIEAITSITGTGWTKGVAKIRWNTSRVLTHNASSLVLIGAANRTTKIGDIGFYEFTVTGCREISYNPVSGYADRAGDTFTGDVVLNNNTKLVSKNTLGEIKDIAFIDNGNIEQIGSTSLHLNLNSSDDPTAIVSGTQQTIYHTGNLKISNLPSYCVNSGNVDTYGKGNLLYVRNPLDSTVLNFKVGTTEYYSDYNYKYVNRAGAGASSIGYTNNVYTYNGTSQYLAVPKLDTFGTGTWSLQRKIKFNSSGTVQGIMGTGIDGAGFGLSLKRQVTTGKLLLSASSNNTSFDIADGSTLIKGLGTNVFNSTSAYYYIRVSFNGTAYKVDYSLDGITWTNDIQVNNSSVVYKNITQLCLGISGTDYFNGVEDMSGAKFIISENTVFEGDLIYAAPNITVTFPNNRTYEISSIADLTGLDTDGPYKIIIEEDNLIKLENGTYHAIATAVKINYSFTGKLPNIYSAVSPGGYSTSYVGVKGLNSYDLFNGSGTGIYWMGQGSGSYPTDTGGVSTFILNMSTSKTISSITIESRAVSNSTNLDTHTHYAYNVCISFSVDGGSTYGTRTSYALNPGLNTIDIAPTSTNAMKFEFPSVGDVNVGGQHGGYYDVWWVGLSIGSISVIETVSYAGGIITEDYALAASTSTINYTPIQQSPIFTSNTQDGFVLSTTTGDTGTEYLMFDGNNSTTYMFTNGGGAGGTFNYLHVYNPVAFIIKSMQIYSTNAPSQGGVADGIGDFGISGSNDGSTWTYVATIPNYNFNNTVVSIDNNKAYKYYQFNVGINLFGGNQGWHGSYVNEVKFGYTTEYASTPSNVGDYFLNLSSKPNKPFKNLSTGLTERQYLKLGEISKVGGILGAPFTYAYNRKATIQVKNITSGNSDYILAHYLGTTKADVYGYFNNIKGSDDMARHPNGSGGYRIGDGSERYSLLQYFSSLTVVDNNSLQLEVGHDALWMGGKGGIFTGADASVIIEGSF